MTFSNDWDDLLKEEMEKPYYKDLRRLLIEEYKTQTIYPEAEAIFRAMRLTSFHDTKVLLLGQDPYHGPGQAQGMSSLYDFRPGGVSSKILTPEESEVSFAGSYEFTQELQGRVDALPKALSTEDAEEVAFLLERLKMSREFDG